MATLLPEGKQSFTDTQGKPLVGGKLYTYDAGTSTPRPTYVDAAATTPNTNPVVLDARGEATVFWQGAYKVVLKDASGVTVWTVDHVRDEGAALALDLLDTAPGKGAELVGFQQAGSGAVARTAQSKMRDVVSVKDFGAVGDGVADDTAEIQAAIAYVKALPTVKSLVFPTGNYKVSSTIEIHGNFQNGVEIRGEKATITSTADAPIFSVNARVPESAPAVRINADISGFVLVGPGKANTSSVALKVARGANVRVRQMSLMNCYRGLQCFGNLISSYDNLYIRDNFYGIDIAPDGIEFAPNDLHFTRVQVVANDRCLRAINFPNGAMTFTGCELEGNNPSGTTTDAVRVVEFFNAGKVTLIGTHMEANPGQYNLYFDGNDGAKLQLIGCEVIPGDSCGNAVFMANASGSPSIFVSGSRVTLNDTGLGQKQLHLSAGVKAVFAGDFSGFASGNLDNVVWLRDGRVVLGRQDPLAGGTGIIFPITQRASSDPNTLDDYAEGTWAPTIIGMTTEGTATYAAANGRYTKIGRQVFVEAYISWSAGTGTGPLSIGNLPFTVSLASTYPAVTIGLIDGVAYTAGALPTAYFEPNTKRISFAQTPSGGGTANTIPYDAAGALMISGTYTVQ